MMDPTKISGIIAQSLCLALCSHLEPLADGGFTKISLRVTLDTDNVSAFDTSV